jgi:hypothetical protein
MEEQPEDAMEVSCTTRRKELTSDGCKVEQAPAKKKGVITGRRRGATEKTRESVLNLEIKVNNRTVLIKDLPTYEKICDRCRHSNMLCHNAGPGKERSGCAECRVAKRACQGEFLRSTAPSRTYADGL